MSPQPAPCPTPRSTFRTEAAVPGGIARLLGPIGRWKWLAALLEGATIGAWIPHPALRLAWIAFVLTFPGALSIWTVTFVARHAVSLGRRLRARPADEPQRAHSDSVPELAFVHAHARH